jgi:hypothetical protein
MITVKIPLRLVNESNFSEHWSKRSKRHKQQKMIVRAFLGQHKYESPPYIILLTRHSPRSFDTHDNNRTNFKWIVDATSEYLLDCKLPGRADHDTRIQWHYAYEKTKNKEHFITIQVESVKFSLTPILS